MFHSEIIPVVQLESVGETNGKIRGAVLSGGGGSFRSIFFAPHFINQILIKTARAQWRHRAPHYPQEHS